jgi:dienelactone hydrolase
MHSIIETVRNGAERTMRGILGLDHQSGATIRRVSGRITQLIMLCLICSFPPISSYPLMQVIRASAASADSAYSASQADSDYSTIFYNNGDLKVEAYFYKPEGAGPFPLVVYNHGSRAGRERQEVPFRYVADVLKASGYAVLVPERRGYGKSDGQTFTEEVGNDVAGKLIRRFREEASDVIAGLDHVRQFHSIDPAHVAIMGWSHGGIVSIIAASERRDFTALVDQAGGALTWNRSPALRTELPAAARKVGIAALCMGAQNDATTDAVKEVGDAIKSAGSWEKTIIYPPFTPTTNPGNIAPGHLIFSSQGISIWQNDVLSFLRSHLH